MSNALRLGNESIRMAALRRQRVLDSRPQQSCDDFTLLAAQACGVETALIVLAEDERQWFAAPTATAARDVAQERLFCDRVTLGIDPLVIADTRSDVRFAHSPLVAGEHAIRFFAGAPLLTPDGFALGALCVLDRQPRSLHPQQIGALQALARLIATQLQLRRSTAHLSAALQDLHTLNSTLAICSHCKGVRDDAGDWSGVEQFIQRHSNAAITQDTCPRCASQRPADSCAQSFSISE